MLTRNRNDGCLRTRRIQDNFHIRTLLSNGTSSQSKQKQLKLLEEHRKPVGMLLLSRKRYWAQIFVSSVFRYRGETVEV